MYKPQFTKSGHLVSTVGEQIWWNPEAPDSMEPLQRHGVIKGSSFGSEFWTYADLLCQKWAGGLLNVHVSSVYTLSCIRIYNMYVHIYAAFQDSRNNRKKKHASMKWARSYKYNSTSQSFEIKPSHNPSIFPLDFPVSSVEPSRRQIRQSVELSGAVDPGVAFRDLREIGFPNFFPTTLFCLKSKEMFDHISSICPILVRKFSGTKSSLFGNLHQLLSQTSL